MENQINTAAHRLAVTFADDNEIPSRYKQSIKKKQINLNSTLEIGFQENVKHWTDVIQNILDRNGENIGWRFINLAPQIQSGITSVSECNDFEMFNNYLMLRRDVENCSPEELGRLSMLLGAFQREIEKRIL